MMYFVRSVGLVSITLLLSAVVHAQSGSITLKNDSTLADTCRIHLIANVKQDSIVLRWAPDFPLVWKQQLQVGYIVERAEIPDGISDVETDFVRLTSQPVKPWPWEKWAKSFKPTDKYAGIAAELIYKETPINMTDAGDVDGMVDKRNDLQMRHSFSLFMADQDARVADASGLRIVDKSFKKNTGYLYRVYYAAAHPDIYCDTAWLYVHTSKITKLNPARSPAVTNGDGAISLRWNSGPASGFNGFHVERADASSNNYTRLNDAPIVIPKGLYAETDDAYYTDSVPNYHKYKYRLIGVTPFGEMSEPSYPAEAMARDLTPPSPALILKVEDNGKKQLVVKWDMPHTSSDLASIEVARSYENDGEYVTVSEKLPITQREYLDIDTDPYGGMFYAIVCRDTAGNAARSLPFYGILTDSFPPAIPQGLQGYVDTNSVVHLKWNLGKEIDLQGYRVYFANSPDHEFSNLTPEPLRDTVFQDTIAIRTLTKHIYYRIAALDNNYNHSGYSPWIKIRRLDVIPPDCPVIQSVVVMDTTVHIKWINSSSDDVAYHYLYRKQSKDAEWTKIKSWEGYPLVTEFTDKNLSKKTYYQYTMTAVDSSNLVSENSPVLSVRTYDNGVRSGIEDIHATFDRESKRNVLNWTYDVEGKYSFIIYRSHNESGLTKYRVAAGNERTFRDNELLGAGEYTYAVRVMYEDGGDSRLSETIAVRVE